jgi:hypothetical protein
MNLNHLVRIHSHVEAHTIAWCWQHVGTQGDAWNVIMVTGTWNCWYVFTQEHHAVQFTLTWSP